MAQRVSMYMQSERLEERLCANRERLRTKSLSCYIIYIYICTTVVKRDSYVHTETVRTKSPSCYMYIFKVVKRDSMYVERLYIQLVPPVIYTYIYIGEERLYVYTGTVSTKSIWWRETL